MIKLISCMLLISCSCMVGVLRAASFRTRRKELEKIIEILRLLDIEITYKKEPLAKSFYKISGNNSCWFTDILIKCSEMTLENNSIKEAWEAAKFQCGTNKPILDDDISILDDLFMGLGKSDTEGQHRLFEPTIKRLNEQQKEAYSAEQRSGKMYVALSTAAGIMISILLL